MAKRPTIGQISDVDVRLLRVFRSVVEAGGVSAAELELNIGRSAISRHLKDLETRLAVVLCRRGRGGFSLTDEGRHVYEASLRLLGALDMFRSEMNDIHQGMSGHLAIALFDKIVTNPQSHIEKAIQLFDEIAPNVELDVYVDTINNIEKGVMDGRFNIGVIPPNRKSTSLDYTSLFPEQMFLYVGHGHTLYTMDDILIDQVELRKHKYVGLGYHSPNMEVGNQKGVKRAASCYDQEAVAVLILSGRYLGYLPDHYAKSFQDQGLLRAINPNLFNYICDFVAINRHAPKPSRIERTFLDCLIKAHSK